MNEQCVRSTFSVQRVKYNDFTKQSLTGSNIEIAINFPRILILLPTPIGIIIAAIAILGSLHISIDITHYSILILHLQLRALRSVLQFKILLVHGFGAFIHIGTLEAAVHTAFLRIRVVAVAVFSDKLAGVLLGSHLRLEDCGDEVADLNNVVSPILALPARVRRAELEVDELLLVHALVVVAVLAVVVVVVVVVAIATIVVVVIVVAIVVVVVVIVVVGKVSAIVVLARGAAGDSMIGLMGYAHPCD